MGFILFEYTVCVLLTSAFASALSFATYAVSHKKTMLFLSFIFFFYFFDVSWVFQADFFSTANTLPGNAYSILLTTVMLITGCGFLTSIWLLIQSFLGEKSKGSAIVLAILFIVSSLACFVLPDSTLRRFCFYLPRSLFLLGMLFYTVYRYISEDSALERQRMWRHHRLLVFSVIAVLLIIAEDVIKFIEPELLIGPLAAIRPDRNFTENIFVLICAAVAIRYAFKTLSLRFDMPSLYRSKNQSNLIDESLFMRYSSKHNLSERESEILYYILSGMTTQEIAEHLTLSTSTVKVHVHNIITKTQASNKEGIIQQFWQFE